ncbi:MAG: hydroxymethylglutaryl-CoA reductase, degradative [Bacteroidetes bacterium]|jgi:hydroxymethylglutaryl-CoA reductase|nr:hydroxymethylglutaryl-CoA reductase, degradative [Bacteroidota bacterium]
MNIREFKDKAISGFSKLTKQEKIEWLISNVFENPREVIREFTEYWHKDETRQRVFDEISENTLTNFYLPYGVAPNFLINNKMYVVPMVIEESSVVAAAAKAAKFWLDKGGFSTQVLSTIKIGQVHFKWTGDGEALRAHMPVIKQSLRQAVKPLTENMEKRGGGLIDIELIDFTDTEEDLYQLRASFETCDSMGANFINSCLEEFGRNLPILLSDNERFLTGKGQCEVLMCILSNFTPESLVRAEVSCAVEDFGLVEGLPAEQFANRFAQAVRIAEIDPYRATTHNKGIFNGIDAVILATGNDFRAVEACGHAYASSSGRYSSLSHAEVSNGRFRFWLDFPMSVGTVGGLTKVHPLAKRSLELLGKPSAKELMQIVAAVGLAQNFGAVKALVTSGIQKGHMKMHLNNILANFEANAYEAERAKEYFLDKVVSFASVREFIQGIRAGAIKNFKA